MKLMICKYTNCIIYSIVTVTPPSLSIYLSLSLSLSLSFSHNYVEVRS